MPIRLSQQPISESIATLVGAKRVRTWRRDDRSSIMVEVHEDDLVYRGPRAVTDAIRMARAARTVRRPFKWRVRMGLAHRHRPWRAR